MQLGRPYSRGSLPGGRAGPTYERFIRMAVRFRPAPDDRPAALDPDPQHDLVCRCRFCGLEWRMPFDEARAEKSLRRHYMRKHPGKVQPRGRLAPPDVRIVAAVEVQYLKASGRTKRSRENRLRVTDGRVHPVTVRRIDDQPRQD